MLFRFPIFPLFFLFAASITLSAETFSWTSVTMGGGGFVSSIVASPIEKNLFYARTDVGGAYRWQESSGKWVSMMDWVDVSERGLLGIEAIAVDPTTPGKVYMVAGTSYFNEGRTAFMRSSDYGATWQAIYTWDTSGAKGTTVRNFFAHGNGMGRGNGEALAIDPSNSNNILYGSKGKGLFRSTDNGSTWNHVSGFTTAAGYDTTWNGSGFSFVTYAPGSSDTVYAGFLREKDNVFMSSDGGITWSLIPGRITPSTTGGYAPRLMPQRIAINPDGSELFITFSDGAGPHTMAWDEGWGPINDWFNRGAILKYTVSSSTWSDISPENYIDPGDNSDENYYDADSIYVACYSGISLNPENPLEMIVSTVGYRGPQFWYIENTGEWKDQWGTNIFYTNDGGVNWIPSFQYYWMDGGVYPTTEQMSENGIGWMFNSSIHWSGCIVIDPFDSKHIMVTSGNGIFETEDITAFSVDSSLYPPLQQKTVWKVLSHGIEETVPYEVVSITDGPLISVIADYDGFRHDDVTKYPSFRHQTNINGSMVSLGSTRALAWAPKGGRLVKVSDEQSVNPTGYSDVSISPLQFSNDTGLTWTVATYENIPGQYTRGECVAISTDGEVTLWVPTHKTVDGNDVWGDYPVQRYENSAWTEVTDIDGAYVVGDPENEDLFYAYKKSDGTFFKSTDKGVSFQKTTSPGTGDWRKFRVVPGKTGDIWLPLGQNGLSRSTDEGTTFNTISSVSYCEAVGFGKAASDKSFPAVYIFGTVSDITGVFQSVDEGATWARVNDDSHEYGGLANGEFVSGDMNIFGAVYMSTAGRGIACRLPSSMVNTGKSIVQKKNVNGYPWYIRNKTLYIKSISNTPVKVSVYTLSGKRLFSKKYFGENRLLLDDILSAKGVKILAIDNGTFAEYVRISTIK